jgi:hypothetical protein
MEGSNSEAPIPPMMAQKKTMANRLCLRSTQQAATPQTTS